MTKLGAVLFSVWPALLASAPSMAAETIAAELTGSRTFADLVLVPSQRFDVPRVYLGPCPGARRGKPLKILISDNRYEDLAREVRFTERHHAEVLYCTRR